MKIADFLAADHLRLRALLAQATADPSRIELAPYRDFRAGLLRHIAMEEKVLFRLARERRGSPLPVTIQLHADHAALATLLVPSPTHALVATIRDILVEHDPLEEGPDGLYAECERLAGPDVDDVLARMHAIPPVRASQHVDEPRIHEAIARLLAARRAP
ncbi:MAG TPA: hemerythrin domain-containing protein [Kofleriaceae bacterium]|nr:hemerythrin domain-containing protein [Kofleriaceae bacterium]